MRSANIQWLRFFWPPASGNLKCDPEAEGLCSGGSSGLCSASIVSTSGSQALGQIGVPIAAQGDVLFILRVGTCLLACAWQYCPMLCSLLDHCPECEPVMWKPCPIENDSWTSDGIEQAAALWLHGHLKRVKAGLVNIILNYPPGMLAA